MLLIVAVIYFLAMIAAALVFVMARFSGNMIKLVFKVLPLFIILNMLANWILSDFLAVFFGGDFYLQMTLLIGLFVFSLIASLLVLAREKKLELV